MITIYLRETNKAYFIRNVFCLFVCCCFFFFFFFGGLVENPYPNYRNVCEGGLGWYGVRRMVSILFHFGSPLSWEVVVCGHCHVTLALTMNGTWKRLSSLLISMQETFWWQQCSASYSLPLPSPPGISVSARDNSALKFNQPTPSPHAEPTRHPPAVIRTLRP